MPVNKHRTLTALVTAVLLVAWLPARADRFSARGDLIGEVVYYLVDREDTLLEVARLFDVGIVELMAANPEVDLWRPEPGYRLRIPGQHLLPDAGVRGVVINLPELRLYFFGPDSNVYSFPIGVGKNGWETPIGHTTIVAKRKDPTWVPPDSIREQTPQLPSRVPPGPDNPLGRHALNLGWAGYVIHGTNRPAGIGRRSSHGCIRLYPEDIAALFDLVAVGTPVTVVNQPFKLGWRDDTLYLEVFPSPQQADEIVLHGRALSPWEHGPALVAALGALPAGIQLDQDAIRKAVDQQAGVPAAIGLAGTAR